MADPAAGPPTDPVPPVDRSHGRRRRIVAAIALGAIIVLGIVTVVLNRPDEVAAPGQDADSDMPITVDGNRILRDGQPWWLLGYNSFVWSGDCGTDEEQMSAADVEAWFASMRHDGHGAARLFFFDGWDQGRLDAAVESAKRHDIYLMITLDDAIGGCGENDKEDGWFADQDERDTFRNHMTAQLERYRGEPTIAWFEYFNEPDPSVAGLREFYDEMGAVADGVDPGRLFSSGTLAPYDEPDAFRNVNESPGVDIASLHEYDEGEAESNHGPDARAESGGKPVIVGEFGIEASMTGTDCDHDFAARAAQFAEKAAAYTTIEGYAGAAAWAWQPGDQPGNDGDECELGNLDVDPMSQDVLRGFLP